MSKNNLSTLFKIILSFSIIFYLYDKTNLNFLYEEFKKTNSLYVICGIIIFLPNTFLYIYKWFLLIKYFYKKKFNYLYFKLSTAIMVTEIFQNFLILDIAKFHYLEKIDKKIKFFLIFNEKLISIITKVLYSLTLIIIYFIFFTNNTTNLNYLIIKSIDDNLYYSLAIILFLFLFIFRNQFIKYYQQYFTRNIIERKKIFLIELLRNFLITILYFLAFYQFYDLKISFLFAVIAPIIEIILRVQIFSTIGVREFIIFNIGIYFNISESIILSSLFVTFITWITSFNNYLISISIKKFYLKKTKIKNLSIYTSNNKLVGVKDFYFLLKKMMKFIPRSKFDRKLDHNSKNIIIIENFINLFQFVKIFFFLLFYRGNSYLLLTEFVTNSSYGKTYNNFNNFEKRGFFFLFFIFFLKKFFFIKNKNSDLRFLIYFKIRFLLTKILSYLFTKTIIAHPNINYSIFGFETKDVINFPYYFKKLDIKNIESKIFTLDFSGYLSKDRLTKLNYIKYNSKIFDDTNIKKIIQKKQQSTFIKSKKEKNKILFSLLISRDNNWKFSSPASIHNSLIKNEIPIFFKKFNDRFNSLGIDSRFLRNKSRNQIIAEIVKLNERIINYNLSYKKVIAEIVNKF